MSPAWARGSCTSLELSQRELLLCDAYVRAGRSDLAECVRGGRLYQVGRDLLDTNDYTDAEDILVTMNNITEIFAPPETRCLSLGEWGVKALDRHKHDPRLQLILKLDEQLASTRQPAVPTIPDEDDPDYEPCVHWTPEMFQDHANSAIQNDSQEYVRCTPALSEERASESTDREEE